MLLHCEAEAADGTVHSSAAGCFFCGFHGFENGEGQEGKLELNCTDFVTAKLRDCRNATSIRQNCLKCKKVGCEGVDESERTKLGIPTS